MSLKSKGQVDLIEDITVEELLADGLVEDVEVSGEEQGKKKLDDKEGAADAPVANAVPVDAPEADPVKPEFDAVAAAVSAAPVAMAPHTQGVPEAPALAPDVQKAADSVNAAIAAAPKAEVPQTKAGLINAMYQHMSSMKTEDLANVYSSLKSPKEVYYEIYKAACDKAQQFRKAALEAHLEANNIKIKYNLDSLSDLPSFSDLLNLE